MRLPKHYQREAIRIKNRLVEESERSNWDRRNESTGEMYCVHGQYLGTWDGPDYMCGWCESGYTHLEVALARAYEMWERDRQALGRHLQDALVGFNDEFRSFGDVVTHDEVGVMLAVTLFLRRELRPDMMRDGMRGAIEKWFEPAP